MLLGAQARAGGFGGVHRWLPRLGFMVLLQVVLGISTLLSQVQIDLAVAHQAMAFLLAGATTLYLADLRRASRTLLPMASAHD